MTDAASYMDRIGRLMDERDGLRDDIKDIYAEAKSHGFDVKALRAAIKMRRTDEAEARRIETERDLMLGAVNAGPV